MRLRFVPVIVAVALWCGGCVQGPLVDFGKRDKPFVDIKINEGDQKDSTGQEKKDTKPPGCKCDKQPF